MISFIYFACSVCLRIVMSGERISLISDYATFELINVIFDLLSTNRIGFAMNRLVRFFSLVAFAFVGQIFLGRKLKRQKSVRRRVIHFLPMFFGRKKRFSTCHVNRIQFSRLFVSVFFQFFFYFSIFILVGK